MSEELIHMSRVSYPLALGQFARLQKSVKFFSREFSPGMGLAGGLVKRVFSRSRSSFGMPKCHERSFLVDKSRWSSIKLYLCGDELNSVLVEDDLASYRGSEQITCQPAAAAVSDNESHQITEPEEHEEKHTKQENLPTEVSSREHAAILIQSAFRGFLARKQYKQHKNGCDVKFLECEALKTTSIQVQAGDSVCSLSVHETTVTVPNHAQRKARTQVFKAKEEWDDSTLSSSIAKLRIQNKLEATTRRERALAYAFSQQLRSCATKKRAAQSNSTDLNVGWSWLERWMATRQQDISPGDCFRKPFNQASTVRRRTVINKNPDAAVEEKESCGSNDVSVNFDGFSTPSQTPRSGCQPTSRMKSKTMRIASRRKVMASYNFVSHSSKMREHEAVAQREKRHKLGQTKSIDEIKARDASEAPTDY